MKLDIYTLIHKAQRQRLFELAIQVAQCDLSQKNEQESVKQHVLKMTDHLRKHSKSEEKFSHPLYKIAYHHSPELVSELLVKLEQAHQKLDPLLDQLDKLSNEYDIRALYVTLNEFIVRYLEHIADEERAQEEILYPYVDDAVILEALQDFQNSLSFEEKLENLRFMMPCLSISEAVNLLLNIKHDAPDAVFENIMVALQGSCDETRWEKICSELI